jgi:signal transduction histidine kinase
MAVQPAWDDPLVMSTITSATVQRWGRDLVFHLAGLLTSIVGFTLWTVGVATSMSVAITYFGLLVALGTLLAFRWFAQVERRRAGLVLGEPIPERYPPPGSGRWTARLHDLIGDRSTWRDFAYTAFAGTVGFSLSIIAISLWASVLGLVAMPAWYWSIPGGVQLGLFDVQTLALAFAATAAGLVLIPVCGHLVRAVTIAQLALMRALLTPRGESAEQIGHGTAAAPAPGPGLTPSLPLHVSLALLLGLVVTIIWIATGIGYFWPIWVWLSAGLSVALDVIVLRAQAAQPGPERWVRVHAEVSGTIGALLVAIWLVTGLGTFWPFWSLLGLGVVLALHALIVFRDRLPLRAREQALVERVDVLTRTRRGALDVQAAELRRIERDLHDGAQARLVALTMQLGRAEEKLADQPEAAALVRRAREDAGAAIAELRDLARGIAPPILADRGLAAAIEALGRRSAIPVTVDADPDRRPLPVIETAAYFVVAEALTNVAKHAGGASAHVAVGLAGEQLVLEVVDSGPGGADPAGGGLTGLRHRVEALDGTLTVVSPPGKGTTIRAQLPCGW